MQCSTDSGLPVPDRIRHATANRDVEELPEATLRVSPVYPEDARSAGVDGTVMVQALVLRDGTVGETRIVKSIPPLDAAASAAVRQWRFKPARTKGEPVAVWVGIPIKFSLRSRGALAASAARRSLRYSPPRAAHPGAQALRLQGACIMDREGSRHAAVRLPVLHAGL